MSGQRHRIRRQVLEIVLRDQGAAWQLQSEVGRIQRESLEAIVDRCCTEAADPERVHRIESIEVDLGHIDPDHLERDLAEKLGPRLRAALSARIHEEDQATSVAGADPETISRLELLAFFARTGHLPWWADASKPRLLHETVGFLLQRAPRALAGLVRLLARDVRELRRLVLHCEEERLSALFTVLAASVPSGLAQRPAELRALLATQRTIADVVPSAFRGAVWLAVLRAVCTEESAGADAVSFWRGTLARAALELGVSYTSLVTGLHEAREPGRAERPDAAFAVVRSLYREVRGEAATSDSAPRESESHGESAFAGLPAEVLAEAQRLLREALEARGDSGPEADSGAAESDSAPEEGSDAAEVDSGAAESGSAPEEGGDAAEADSDAAESDSHAPGDGGAGEVEAILDRLERVGIQPIALLRELRAAARGSAARGSIPWLDELKDLDKQATLHGAGARETRNSLVRLVRGVVVSRGLPRRTLLRLLEAVESMSPVGLPAEALAEAQRSLREAIEAQGDDASYDDDALVTDSVASATDRDISAADGNAPAADEPVLATDSDAPAPDSNAVVSDGSAPAADSAAPVTDSDAPAAGAAAEEEARFADEVETLLDRLERSGLPLTALFAEIRAAARRAASRRSGASRRPVRTLASEVRLPGAVLDPLKDLDHQISSHGPGAPETASSAIRLLRGAIASRRLSAPALLRALEELDRAAAAAPPAHPLGEAQTLLRRAASSEREEDTSESPRLDLAYADSEDVYVENAGLVILWPFLGHLFERLDLMEDKRFKDARARHRAVGLLQHLVTEDPSPPEYQVLLARALCGMSMTEVFDFGPPVTEAEAEECSNLLAAVIANAPVLKEMSIAGFRGSFLLRKGVLGTRDGSWLLRVERASYDVVLDRFPWGTSWVKLPWMDTPVNVEW